MNSHVFAVAWLLWPLLCVGRLPAYLEPHFTNLPSSQANHENFSNPNHMEEVSTYESPSTNDGTTRPGRRVIITSVWLECNTRSLVTNVRSTELKATNVADGLRRIPAGFYVSVSIADEHWRTSNNPMDPTTGVAEWNDPIDLPLDVSAEVNVQIYALFEPGNTIEQLEGELLHKRSITVAELIEHSRSSRPIAFSTTEGDVVSSGTCLQVTTETLSPADDSEVVHCRAAARRADSKADDEPQATVSGQNYIHPRDGHQESPFKRAGRKVKALISSVFRARGSSNVSNTVLTAVEQRSNRADLDEAIEHHRSALQLMRGGHPGRSSSLSNLGTSLQSRFKQRGDGKDLDEAIECHQSALQLRPEGHPQHSSSLNNLANALWIRFEQRGDGKDLDKAIEHHQGALQLRPEGHPQRSLSLNNLAGALQTRFEQRGDGKDLDEGVKHHQGTLQLTPKGHPQRSTSLNNLATALWTRFEQRGDGKDLDEAIEHHQGALQLRPEGHPQHSSSLNNLAGTLLTRFEQRGDGKDLDEAIEHHQGALQLMPEGHPQRSSSLNNLANALRIRFQQRGDGKDLDEAIEQQQGALQLMPEGHPQCSSSLNNLANALWIRFEQRGDGKDLDEAIEHHQGALQLRPEGHPQRSLSLNNLATTLWTRFEQRGDGKDLDKAIEHHQGALQLMPEGHPQRSSSLNNLAGILQTRFEQRGDGKDLDEAIEHHQGALQLMPEGHPQRSSSLNNLATALRKRFQQQGDGKDLDEAIEHHQGALQLTPEGHPQRSLSLNNLANALRTRFQQRGDGKDLDKAIEHHQGTLQLTPEGHPWHSSSLNNLAGALGTRFQEQGDEKDLDEALQLSYAAVEQSVTDFSHLTAEMHLASLHLILWSTQHMEKNLQDAMYHYKEAAEFAHANLFEGLSCCQQWITVAEQNHHMSALDAYTKTLHLLDYHISATTSVLSQHQTQKHFPPDLAVNAASCALRQGNTCLAVELLEQGRALHWTQIARFRTSLEDLYSQDPSKQVLVGQFQNLSALLNKCAEVSFTHDKFIAEARQQQYRNLLEQWNKVVDEIRTIKGFSHFLLPPLFADLQEAACQGPIIILIASQFSCDAIIVLYMQPPIHLPLKMTLEELHDLVLQLGQNYQHPQGPDYSIFIELMDELWKKVIFPVVQKLKAFMRRHSHIWWCPTSIFTALPLHCAGEYKHGGQVLSKLFVSSYTPSLSALIKAHTRSTKMTQEITFAAIGQATPDTSLTTLKFSPLHYIEHELDGIEALLPIPSVMFTKVMGLEATRDQALQMLVDNQWLHISCHGRQVPEEPFKSCLAMADGLVSLLDIINANISTHEFAFLSACETAMGDLSTPDEVIHLAAGLQFMGVKSVIGTLWQVRDDVAYKVVLAFYKEFCKNGTLDCTMAARALHAAVATLAKDGVSLQDRAMFVHIGI
ncbi:TPR-like protein [Melanogaster broomeanus]|nr:TPR-like protein [Melanogaster broomeanus]